MNKRKLLEVKNLSKTFCQGNSNIDVISNMSLEIFEGELVAIIGASGSGKSTFLQIVGLLDKPTSGSIIYDNNIHADKLSNSEREKLRLNFLGFVYQYHHLLKDFSARENIAMPSLIKGDSDYAISLTKADEILDNLGMFNKRFNYPPQLSGGEQQRVAIARALFNNPKLILADEPTGNLDPKTSEIVFEILLNMVRKNNSSAIIVTHNHSLASRADRVISLFKE